MLLDIIRSNIKTLWTLNEMHGHTFSNRDLIFWHLVRASAIFMLMAFYATNASAWGWSRSSGQSSSVSAPSNDTGSDSTSDVSNLEATSSEPTDQDVEQNEPATSTQDVQDSVQVEVNSNSQVTSGTIDPDVRDGDNNNSSNLPVMTKRSKRKNMLIKKWRAEFAREDLFYVVTDQPIKIPDVKFQLERIQSQTPDFPKYQLPFEGSDLALLEEWINDSLDRHLPQRPKSNSTTSLFSANSKLNAQDVQKKIADLETKSVMLSYGNKALQAMGIFID